ncbi:VVA0879 family protein [Rhodococcoides kyotonense]|uniref:Uncharacterized protein n=1 Tax=Rhodococcoides kyotonense TaxID=398843 RepID=A0A239FQ96_9NOCA|nr:VVA0879 family protein [Rhodococcus kyotonensis]SNS59107.1 hypothetical protein SAMN05421642_103409 [Rhodococcus kyotonensis]
MSSATTVKRTQEELVAELRARFGDDHKQWAFICPHCEDIATAQDFKDALTANDSDDDPFQHLGQICIGRLLGVLKRDQPKGGYTGRGCDWAAFGLFRGPEFVIMPDGKEVASFAIAPRRDS